MKNIFNNDEENITYSCFLACLATFCICIIYFTLIALQINYKTNKSTEETLNMIAAYIITATDDEYDDITKQIRQDLILHTNTKQFIQYIPNTANQCLTCQMEHPLQVYLLAINTGEVYSVNRETPQPSGSISFTGGYDEISKTNLDIVMDGDLNYNIASLTQEQDIVSIHRMKTIFCDDCIDKILTTINNQLITSFVFFSTENNTFYPITNNQKIQSAGCNITTSYNRESKEMQIKYYK